MITPRSLCEGELPGGEGASHFWVDREGVSHGERPIRRTSWVNGRGMKLRGHMGVCSWQEQRVIDNATDPYVFTCENCKRVVCYCGGHGCEVGAPERVEDAEDYCDECCPCGGGAR